MHTKLFFLYCCNYATAPEGGGTKREQTSRGHYRTKREQMYTVCSLYILSRELL
jgi:hypothetical protein